MKFLRQISSVTALRNNKPSIQFLRFFFGQRFYAANLRDSYDYTNLLQLCKGINSVQELHAQIITTGYDQNEFLATKLIGKYADSESKMENARFVFDRLFGRDVFVWNVVIQGYANWGPFIEALNLFDEMRINGEPTNCFTFPFVLKACGAMKNESKGKIVHSHVMKSGLDLDLFIGNALISFYSKCQDIEASRKVFDEMPLRDTISWNSMISGYSSNGQENQAMILFHTMVHDQTTISLDHATLISILPACVKKSAVQVGFWVHSFIIKSGIEIDAPLSSSLISMYANCGRVNIAREVFNRTRDKNVIVWSSIIRCYGMHGLADEALRLFKSLEQSGLTPDSVIFLNMLSTCSHGGLVAEGHRIFDKMEGYGVEKTEEHYASMVDLLCRAGFLDQAVKFIETMPVAAGKNVYGALLGGCRIHNAIDLAKEVAEKLFDLDRENAGRYVIMANMYEDAGRWEEAAEMRKLLRERKIRKPVGCSSIEVESVHHVFGKEDESHPFTEQIFDTLENLDWIMEGELEPT